MIKFEVAAILIDVLQFQLRNCQFVKVLDILNTDYNFMDIIVHSLSIFLLSL